MRIISNFHDYYDIGMKYGQDSSLIYFRNQSRKEVESNIGFNSILLGRRYRRPREVDPNIRIYPMLICFCGDIFPSVRLSNKWGHPESDIFAYSIEEVDDFITSHYKEKDIKGYFSKTSIKDVSWSYTFNRDAFIKFFSFVEDKKQKISEFMASIDQCPIIVIPDLEEHQKWVFNSKLKDYNFEKIVDPYTAFQKISMFLGNQATPIKPIPVISNNDMIESKGFHLKESFRKQKST